MQLKWDTARDRLTRFGSYPLQTLGWLAVVLGAGCLLFVGWAHRFPPGLEPGLAVIVCIAVAGFALVGAGAYAYTLGKSLRAVSADELLSRDRRPPVLYLCSTAGSREIPGFMDKAPVCLVTEEEQLAEVLNKIGPCVALGSPGQKAHPLGMGGESASGEEWQRRAADYVDKSRLIVIRAGATGGAEWAIERTFATAAPQKIIIIVPEDKEAMQAFCGLANGLLPRPIPEIGTASWSNSKVSGYVCFSSDWTPHYVQLRFPGILRATYKPLVVSLYREMGPVYDGLGMPYTRLPFYSAFQHPLGWLVLAILSPLIVTLALFAWPVWIPAWLLVRSARTRSRRGP